jgi:asparaginyl-tRNA synthetase
MDSAQIDSWLDWADLDLGAESPPRLAEAFECLEAHLASHTFVVGERLSLADVSLACSVNYFKQTGCPPLPKAIARWLSTCLATEAFQGLVPAADATSSSAPAGAVTAGETSEIAIEKYSSCVGGRMRISNILGRADAGKGLIGKEIVVCGWVRTMREGGKGAFYFVELNDGSSPLGMQCIIGNEAQGFETLKGSCGTGASLKCKGEVIESQGKNQAIELRVATGGEVQLFGGVDAAEYPLAKKNHTLEYLRSIAHLRPRTLFIGSVQRVRSALALATHQFFQSRGFHYIHTPLITASDCEGAGEMFQVTTVLPADGKPPAMAAGKVDYSKDFFGKPAFLTVSGQLAVENFACALSNVYTFGPTFRAEVSHTSRHLAEFWMIEPELCFADLWDDMQCAEDYLKHCLRHVMEHNRADIEFFDKQISKGLIERLEHILAAPFARVSYTEAVDILIKESPKAKFEKVVEWGIDLGSEHERWLVEKVTKLPTVVYNYPKDIKAFYMRLNDDNKTVQAMDVLVPYIGEVIGGSAREERLDVLDRRLTEMELDPKDYWWYRDLRRFGTVPHAGFGLGFERLIMLATGVENIRDVIPYPRYPGHAEF